MTDGGGHAGRHHNRINRFMTRAGAGSLVLYEIPPDALLDLRKLMRKYADQPIDLADASLVWLAGAIGLLDIVTLDDRDFTVYRTAAGKTFRNLLPRNRSRSV